MTREVAQAAKIIVNLKDGNISVTNPKMPANQDYDNREKCRQFSVDFAYSSVDINSGDYVTQESIYQSLGVNVLSSVFEGFNACVLAYGQSGTGKTYTMMGHGGDLGLTPRICQGLFSRISTMNDKKMTFRIEVSFLEIYNERVVDLLRSLPSRRPRQTLKVREHPKSGPYVQDLSRHVVTDFNTAQALLEKGIQNRSVAATRMHDYSSRSHSIFTIYFTQARLDEDFPSEVTSKIHLVDLAGSERATADLCRVRLKEGANINKSLVALGNVICSLADKSQSIWSLESSSSRSSTGDSAGCPTSTASPVGSPGQKSRVTFVPYRDSVLTWLLKDSLGGNAKTIMLATVSPASVAYNETLSTLRYAQRAKCIVNRPVTNEDASVKLIRELRAEIERLRAMLATQNDHSKCVSEAEIPVSEKISENENKAEELTRIWFEKWKELQHRMHFSSFLASAQSMDSVADCEMPYLIGINSDTPSSGVHIYYLKEGKMKVGSSCGSGNAPDINISGEDVADEHCILQLRGRVATLTPITGVLCLLNGEIISSSATISLGDVIQLGKSITLRYWDPWQLPRRTRSIRNNPTTNPDNCTEKVPGPQVKDPNGDSLLGDSQSDIVSCEDIPECKSERWMIRNQNPETTQTVAKNIQTETCLELNPEDEISGSVGVAKRKNSKGLKLVIDRKEADDEVLAELPDTTNGEYDGYKEPVDSLDVEECKSDSVGCDIDADSLDERQTGEKAKREGNGVDRHKCTGVARNKMAGFTSTDEESVVSGNARKCKKVAGFNAMVAMQKRKKRRKKAVPHSMFNIWDSTSEEEFQAGGAQCRKLGPRKLNRLDNQSPPALPYPYGQGLRNRTNRCGDAKQCDIEEVKVTLGVEEEYRGNGMGGFGRDSLREGGRSSDREVAESEDCGRSLDSLEVETCDLGKFHWKFEEKSQEMFEDRFGGSSVKTYETWPTSCDSLTFVYLGPAVDWRSSCDSFYLHGNDDPEFLKLWTEPNLNYRVSAGVPVPSDESDTLTLDLPTLPRTLGRTYSILPKISNSNEEICSTLGEDTLEKYPSALRGARDYSQSTLDIVGSPEKVPLGWPEGPCKERDVVKKEVSLQDSGKQSGSAEGKVLMGTEDPGVGDATRRRQDLSLVCEASPKGVLPLHAFESGIFVGLHGTTSNTLRNLQMSFCFGESGTATRDRSAEDVPDGIRGDVGKVEVGKCDHVEVTLNKGDGGNEVNGQCPASPGTAKSPGSSGPGSPFRKMEKHVVYNILGERGEDSDRSSNKDLYYWEQKVWPSSHGFSSFLSPSTSAPPGFLPRTCAKPGFPKNDSAEGKSEPAKKRVTWTWKDPVDMIIDLDLEDLEGRCGSLELRLDDVERRRGSYRKKKCGQCDALDIGLRAHCECKFKGSGSVFSRTSSPSDEGYTCTCPLIRTPDPPQQSATDSDVEFSGHVPEDMIRLLKECREVRKKAWREIGLAHTQLRCMDAGKSPKMCQSCPIHGKVPGN